MRNLTTCPECGSEYYEFPCGIETKDRKQRLVYICENEHTYYGPWS